MHKPSAPGKLQMGWCRRRTSCSFSRSLRAAGRPATNRPQCAPNGVLTEWTATAVRGPRHAAVAQSTCRPSPLRRQAGARSASSRTSQPLALVASPGRPQRRAPTSRNDLWCQGRRRASLRGEVSHPQPALLPSWWVQRANTGSQHRDCR